MKLRSFVISQSASLLLTLAAFGQTAPSPEKDPQQALAKGVVVEKIDQGSAGERAGFRVGDILLEWIYADIKSEIESPSDLLQIEIEQAYRGAIKIEGFRGTEKQVWILEPDTRGIMTRPNFSGPLLAMYRQGQELAQAGKPDEAAQRWQAAAAEAQKLPSTSRWAGAWLLFRAAGQLSDAGHWDEADNDYREAIELGKEAGAAFNAQLLLQWAITYQRRNDLLNAEKYGQQALAERLKLGAESMSLALNLEYLGLLSWRQAKLAEAEQYYRQSLLILDQLVPGSIYVASCQGNLGIVYDERGDLARAEQYYRKALSIQEKLSPGSLNVSSNLSNLGVIALARGDLAKAEKYLTQALTILTKLAPNSMQAASILPKLGDVVLRRGDPVKAGEYYEQSLAITKKLAPDSLLAATSLGSLGELAQYQGDITKAEEYYQQALAIKERLVPGSLQVALTLKELGDVMQSQGDLSKAEEYYRQALAIREKLDPGSRYHIEALGAMASLMRRRQQLDSAAQLYQQTLNALDSQIARLGGSEEERSDFRARYEGYYKDYIDLLIAQKQPDLAFQVLERSRARTLLETLAAAHVDIRRGADASLLERERELRDSITATYGRRIRLLSGEHTEQQITSADQEVKKLLAQYDDVEGQIRVSSPAYAALTQPPPLNTKQIQQELLDGNTLLLEYSLGEERSYVFVVGASSLEVYPIPKRAAVERAAQRVYELLNLDRVNAPNDRNKVAPADGEAEYAKAAARLSRMVLGAVASQLGRKRLLIVSDGALHYVPFAALPSPGKSPAPLMVRHEIINLPCASVLSALRRERLGRKMAPRMVAVLADPVFDSQDARVKNATSRDQGNATTRGIEIEEDTEEQSLAAESLTRSLTDMGAATKGTVYLPRLQLTRQEAHNILAVTPPGEAMPALDFKASRATALSPNLAQYRIVHFATHGLMNSKHPELSGLVLSLVDEQGRPQNGFLGLQDIYNLNLPAELVVLSACETGLGKNIQGEGLIGLTRGFMYAGASRVVASLWKIDDQGTAIFMGEFYRAMEQQGMRPAAALRAAQMHMWQQKRWSSPYYWAAFQIHGEWK